MCNYRRDNSRDIPKTGRGFKIVSDYGDGKWYMQNSGNRI